MNYRLGLLLSSITLTGCATVMSGVTQEVEFRTEPAGAKVVVKDDGAVVFAGVTPVTANLLRGESYFKRKRYDVELSKEGFPTRTLALEGSYNFWHLGNLLLLRTGIISMFLVDPVSGAMWSINPGTVSIDLANPAPQQPKERTEGTSPS